MSSTLRPLPLALAFAACLGGCGGLQEPTPDTGGLAGDGAPTAPVVAIDPVAPLSSQDLVMVLLQPGTGAGELAYRVRWTRDGEEVTELDDEAWVPASMTGADEAWAVEAWAEDAAARASTPSTDEVVVAGAPPWVSVAITPVAPIGGDPLSATAQSGDPDGGDLALTWSWYRDGYAVVGLDGGEVPAGLVARGETWLVRVEATDGDGLSALGAAQVVIGNTAPSLGSVWVVEPVTVVTGASCVTQGYADPDGDVDDTRFAWTLDGKPLAGVVGPFVDGALLERDDTVSCTATPSDGDLSGPPLTSPGVTVRNAPPTAPEVWVQMPAQPFGPMQMQILVPSWDPDGDPITYATAWYEDGVLFTTGATCPRSEVGAGEVWHIEVTPNDGFEDGPAGVGDVVF